MNVVQDIKSFLANRKLPEWAEYVSGEEAQKRGKPHLADGYYEIDPDVAYQSFLGKLGFVSKPITQYEVEVARRCFTKYLLDKLGHPITVVIPVGSGRWALKNFPEGRGADAGAAEYRQYYEAVKP